MAFALIVLDASAALALLLTEPEGAEVAELINNTTSSNGQIFIPGIFWYELGNGLFSAENADRITSQSSSMDLYPRVPHAVGFDLPDCPRRNPSALR